MTVAKTLTRLLIGAEVLGYFFEIGILDPTTDAENEPLQENWKSLILTFFTCFMSTF